MHVRNLTPHRITIIVDTEEIVLTPDGPPARVVLAPDSDDGNLWVQGVLVPVLRTARTTQVTDLPEHVDGVALIVARLVAEARPDRDDLFFVHRTVRDTLGRVIGAQALARVP